jgi:hypothetical protein
VSNAQLIFSPFCVFPELPLFGRSGASIRQHKRIFKNLSVSQILSAKSVQEKPSYHRPATPLSASLNAPLLNSCQHVDHRCVHSIPPPARGRAGAPRAVRMVVEYFVKPERSSETSASSETCSRTVAAWATPMRPASGWEDLSKSIPVYEFRCWRGRGGAGASAARFRNQSGPGMPGRT